MGITVKTIQHGQIIEVCVAGRAFTDKEYDPIIEAVTDQLALDRTKFIINLEDVDTLNSSGLNALIKVFTQIRNIGGELYIVNISSKINQVLLLTKLNTVLNIATSFKHALEQLNK